MSRKWQVAIGLIVVAIILLVFNIPLWVPLVLVVAAVAVPVVGYMMLDSSQRARVRRMRDRKQLP